MSASFRGAALGCVPAACMLLFTFIGLGKRVPTAIAGALQHFAAGVLLCAIGTELLPAMVNAMGWRENLASAVGYFLGVAVLIGLGILLPEAEDGDDLEEEGAREQSEALEMSPRGRSPHRRTSSLRAMATECSKRTPDTMVVSGEEQSLLSSATPAKAFPTALLLAVAVDSALDGLLIGIAVVAAGPSAGPMMSASLSVEMSFLGLTLAAALHPHHPRKSVPAAFLGPAVLVAGAAVGGLLAETLSHSPALLVCLLSFGTSALLYMVAEELLLEAHEQGEHIWWVDLQLYVGFFASVMASKFIPGE